MAWIFRKRRRQVDALSKALSDEELIQSLDPDIPWMGEEPFLVTSTKHPPRPIIKDLEYVRRILISWLVGRAISKIEKRVGCSERAVRNVIVEVIYIREANISVAWSLWCELGLIGGICLPFEQPDRTSNLYKLEERIIIVCQLCHRKAGRLRVFLPQTMDRESLIIEQQTLLKSRDLRDGTLDREAGTVQGHLMCHFKVGKDPIRKPAYDPWARNRISWGMSRPDDRYYRAMLRRTRHLNRVIESAVNVYLNFIEDEPIELVPIVDGKELSKESARRRWMKMLGGKP